MGNSDSVEVKEIQTPPYMRYSIGVNHLVRKWFTGPVKKR